MSDKKYECVEEALRAALSKEKERADKACEQRDAVMTAKFVATMDLQAYELTQRAEAAESEVSRLKAEKEGNKKTREQGTVEAMKQERTRRQGMDPHTLIAELDEEVSRLKAERESLELNFQIEGTRAASQAEDDNKKIISLEDRVAALKAEKEVSEERESRPPSGTERGKLNQKEKHNEKTR